MAESNSYGIKIPEDHVIKVLKDYQFQLSQLQVCEEECSELIKAISKYVRSTQGMTNISREEARAMIVEELTHVAVCLHMLQKMFDVSQDEINEQVKIKEDVFWV